MSHRSCLNYPSCIEDPLPITEGRLEWDDFPNLQPIRTCKTRMHFLRIRVYSDLVRDVEEGRVHKLRLARRGMAPSLRPLPITFRRATSKYRIFANTELSKMVKIFRILKGSSLSRSKDFEFSLSP